MKKLLFILLFVVALGAPQTLFGVDLGIAAIDLGIPLIYTNTIDLAQKSNIEFGDVVDNLRTGLVADVLFKFGFFGIGANTGLLIGLGGLADVPNIPVDFVLDIPLRVLIRFSWESGYFQLHTGPYFNPVGPLSTVNIDSLAIRYWDVGGRLVFGPVGVEGGYFVPFENASLQEPQNVERFIPNTNSSFYVGVYFKVL